MQHILLSQIWYLLDFHHGSKMIQKNKKSIIKLQIHIILHLA